MRSRRMAGFCHRATCRLRAHAGFGNAVLFRGVVHGGWCGGFERTTLDLECAARAPASDSNTMQSANPIQLRAQAWLPAFLATGMSAFVAAVVTAINTGIDGGYPWRWLLAWSIACPAAIVAAYLFRPWAWRAACLVSRLTLR